MAVLARGARVTVVRARGRGLFVSQGEGAKSQRVQNERKRKTLTILSKIWLIPVPGVALRDDFFLIIPTKNTHRALRFCLTIVVLYFCTIYTAHHTTNEQTNKRTVFFCTSYEMPVKVFFSVNFLLQMQ